jgi:Flp pilus assembly protein TadG
MEAALVLPLLAVFLFGCADFGRAIHAQIAITNAARVGAEYGATHRFTPSTRPDWESRLREAVQEEAASLGGLDPDALDVVVEVEEPTPDDLRVHVQATYPFRTAVSWPGLPDTLTLRHEAAMRQYQ